MDITDYMHPLFKHGKTKKVDSIMNATIDALNKPLTDAEQRILKSKTNVLLSKAPKEWLDYFGSYLGLHRKDKESDADYRKRLMEWVLVNKNDVNSIRNAISDFLEISADRVFIYEPYQDIFFYNHVKSLWNSFSFRPSTYYNYAIIDIKIDAEFPYKEIADIINLFRPAGVIWAVTASINSYNPDAPIIDDSLDGSAKMEFDDTEYVGFNTHDSIIVTPELNDDILVTNPVYWNVSDSLWNGGKEYGNSYSAFQDYLVFGEYDTEFIPSNEGFSDLRKFVHNYDKVSNHLMSVKDNKGISFNLNTYDTSNSLSISNSELTSDKERNLLLDTISKQSSSWFTKGELDNGKYLGSFINKTNSAWDNARYNFQDLVSRGVINTTDTYVYSTYIKVDSSTELSLQDFTFYGLNCSSHGKHPYAAYDDIDLTTWTQIYVPLKFNNLDTPNDFSDYQLSLRFECDKSTPNGYVYWACPKLEKGTKATDYSIAPEDIDNNLPTPICDGVLQSDGTLGIHANTSYSHTFDNGDYITFDMMSVVDSKVTINNNLYTIGTKWKRFTIPLDNHILIVSPLNNTFIKNVSISETLPSTSSDNSFYPYNEIRDKIKGVAGILDIKHTLVALSSRYTTGKSVAEIANSYADKYLSMVLSTDTFGNNSKCALELFDYSCGLWVQYKEFSLSDKVQQLNIKIDDVTNYLNENGLLCFRIRTLDTDTITTIVVDYVGFSFYDTIYNNPRINWYYNAYRLLSKLTFEDNQLGSWAGGTIKSSDTPIGNTYHNYLNSNGSELVNNETFNVVPTTTYYLDIWYKATADVSLKFGDTVLDILPSATSWEHIGKDITIPDKLLSGNISLSSASGEIDIAYISIKIDEGADS